MSAGAAEEENASSKNSDHSSSGHNSVPEPYKDLIRKAGSEFDNINVVVRVKPVSSKRVKAADKNQSSLFPAAGQIQVTDPNSGQQRSFTFNVVFEPEATQEEVFEHSGIKRLIDMALEGFACTVFAYGQTGSGKTFTLTGNVFESENEKEFGKNNKEKKTVGMIQLAFAYLFEQIKLRKDRGVYYVVTASYLEVYNEQVLDLLNPSPKCLNVRWSKDRGFYAENLFKVECEDIMDLEGVLEEGCKMRQVRSHQMNENSSRSHSLLTVVLASETQDPEDPQGYIRREGRLCLVDLAGSEKTKRTKSRGETFVEANNINKSLLVLGNCISCLASPKRRAGHIPYRDSTLTKLLADSLSGSGMTLMIACVSPLPQDSSETINTLRYAMRAKKVKTNPIVRMDPRELLILSLKREVRLLRMENNYLRQQLNLGSGFFMPNAENRSNNTLTASASSLNDDNKYNEVDDNMKQDLLAKYMQENEGLRAENAQLHQQREILIHDHELVCRENERLQKRTSKEERRPSIIMSQPPSSATAADTTAPASTTTPGAQPTKKSISNNNDSNNNNSDNKSKTVTPDEKKDTQTEKTSSAENGDHHRNGDVSELTLEIRGTSAVSKTRVRRK